MVEADKTVQAIVDALDGTPEDFERMWDDLSPTPDELAAAMRLLTPGVTDLQRGIMLDAAAKKKFGSWPEADKNHLPNTCAARRNGLATGHTRKRTDPRDLRICAG